MSHSGEAVSQPASWWRTRLHWGLLTGAVLLTAAFSLDRLRHEELYAFPMPVDRETTGHDYGDAARTARKWFLPALTFLGLLGAVATGTAREGPLGAALVTGRRIQELGAKQPLLMTFFALACLTDAYTTWAYAQRFSLADEMHPGIKLVAYAYGLTTGVFLAKAIQAGLVLILAALFPSFARTLLLVTAGGYAVAAGWNQSWL